jgi:hypothetical protein
MTTNAPGSAKVYTFPPRGRFLVRAEASEPLASTWPQASVRIASGSGWYHDEAIAQAYQADPRQAEPHRKN